MSDETEVTTPDTQAAGPEAAAEETPAEGKAEEQAAPEIEAAEPEAAEPEAEAPVEDGEQAVEEPVAEGDDEAADQEEALAEADEVAEADVEETVADAEDVEEAADDPVPVFEEAEVPTEEGPAELGGLPPVRIARVYVCERGHRTSVLWGEPATCYARPTRSGPACGLPLYHITELPEQVQRALNPLKASKKASKKK